MTSAATRVVVRPQGAERETLIVLLLCAAILLAAASAIALRVAPAAVVATSTWQLDARIDLTPAEQGINADLQVAADEILFLLEGGAAPTPAQLADEALPPFAHDPTQAARGGHEWSLVDARSGFMGWVGRTTAPEVAGSFLLRIRDETGVDGLGGSDTASRIAIWLDPSSTASIDGLPDEALVAAGWKRIVNRYDGSVTREQAP